MTLAFTDSGLLTPAAGIETDLDMLEKYFVRAFPNSEIRERLFENYRRYVERFQDEIFPWFEMWVDGSFVTMKENPKDVDVVTFLDWQVCKYKEAELEKFYSYNLEKEGIDAYIVPVYPDDHPRFTEFSELKKRWRTRFTNDSKNEGVLKGYLMLNFEKIVE